MKTSKMLQDARNGLPAEGGYTDPVLLKNFRDSFASLLSNIQTVSNLFEGYGNGLRLMARSNRIEFESGRQ